MVKIKQIIFSFLVFSFCLLIFTCSLDVVGFFSSSDLDERLSYHDKIDFSWNLNKPLSLEGDYSFIVISDTHFQDDKIFDLTAERINGVLTDDIKFVVFLGDITQSGYQIEIDNFVAVAEGVTVPVYPVIGNHDIYFGNWKLWLDKIGSTNYRIDNEDTTLIFLDTANSYFGKEQLDWLEKQMTDRKKTVFVFTHSPLFVPSNKLLLPPDFQQVTYTNERARILSILNNKATAMFMGHLHLHFTNKAGKVKYVSVESYIDDKSYLLATVENGSVSYETKKFE